MPNKNKIKSVLFKRSKLYSWLVLVIGLTCCGLFYQSALVDERTDTYNQYQQRAEIHAKDIEAEFKRSFFQVSSVANLFSSSSWVTYAEFSEFVDRVYAELPEDRRITAIHRFSVEDANKVIDKIRQNPERRYKNFDIFDFTPPSKVSPATVVDGHYSVLSYTFPERQDNTFVGRNILKTSPIGPLIYPVIHSRSAAISDLSEPVTGVRNAPFILYIYPIIGKNQSDGSEPIVRGLIVSSHIVSSLFKSNVSQQEARSFDYLLRDKNNNLYDYRKNKLIDQADIDQRKLKFSFPIELVNNRFELIITPVNQLLEKPDSLLFALFLAGILLTLAATFITHTLFSIHRNLTKEVARKTSELTKQKNQLNINNQQLSTALDEAKVSENAKAEFLANMSHEIRTPLNGVIGLTNLLKDTRLSNVQREYVDKLAFSGKHLLTVINDILDFSKIESGNIVLEHKGFSIYSVVDNLKVAFDEIAKAKGLEFNIIITGEFYADLMGDIFRINQVLINLCGNAIKFTETGKVDVAISMSRDKGSENSFRVQFKISDTGVGIDEIDIDGLFSKFSQADSSTTRKYGGTGLGLIISQKLCQSMGGDIAVESSKNKGSTFTATMLLKLNKDVIIDDIKQFKISQKADVLVVDDNPIALDILSNGLTRMGLRPIALHSAEQGLLALQSMDYKVKLIISDWTMPNMNGARFIEEITRLNLKVQPKIIILSAYETEIIDNLKGQLPIDFILNKPCPADKLFQAIGHCLNDTQEQIPAKKEKRLNNLKVLVVEDNEINQVVVQHMLIEHGAQVTIANNGQEAVDLINQSNEFHIILMDIHMPVLDGIQTTKIIRAHADEKISRIPIIALSANVLEKDVQSYLEIGMNAHDAKPVDIEKLINTILTLV